VKEGRRKEGERWQRRRWGRERGRGGGGFDGGDGWGAWRRIEKGEMVDWDGRR